MTACQFSTSPIVELYFYGEVGAEDRARLDDHLAGCGECRQRLQDLHAIRQVLAERPLVDAPAANDWSGFMRRLDVACAVEGKSAVVRLDRRAPARWRPAFAIAATLALVTIGVLVAARYRTAPPSSVNPATTGSVASVSPAISDQDAASSAGTAAQRGAAAGRHLMEQSEEHFERSKLVVLGLATRDPRTTPATDWEYERQLAGTLLSDTRLYRLAAQSRGLSDLARVMGDLETVLLEASLSDQKDPEALDRLQRLIRKRDLVVKMQVVSDSAGI